MDYYEITVPMFSNKPAQYKHTVECSMRWTVSHQAVFKIWQNNPDVKNLSLREWIAHSAGLSRTEISMRLKTYWNWPHSFGTVKVATDFQAWGNFPRQGYW